ncbi:hypothetical protein BGZ57DRAFT_953350 [Hyaloscypha finlandica]|nr:hypothetical protein BGZ57DRAFT_953350 [Hyaloscypha finlandica]
MDTQEKTPRELEENSPFLAPQSAPSPPPPSYISHVTYQPPTTIPFLHTAPRASTESSHSSYRDKFALEECHDKNRSRKALMIFAGFLGVIFLVVVLSVFGGVYHWGRGEPGIGN